MSRRDLLRSALLLSAAGGGMIILGRSLGAEAATVPEPTLGALRPSGSSGISGSPVKVKVMYFQMSQIVIDIKEEHFDVQSPAYFSSLLKSVVENHPLLSAMIPSMMILVDGVPGQPGTLLKDGDEVDLIPAIAGG